MNGLYAAALAIQRFMEERKWRFCVIGGLAVVRWGRPRATQDVDISLLTEIGSEENYVDEILGQFTARLADARQFALDHRVLLIEATNSVPVDISLAAASYEADVISRATPYDYASGTTIVTASAEDMVVLKSFAARSQDWIDVEGILVRQQGKLDWDYILGVLAPLCEIKDNVDILARLEELRARIEPG